MNTLQFDESQVRAVGEVSLATQDEPEMSANIVSSELDWYIRASVDFEAVPEDTHEIVFDVYLENLGKDKDSNGTEFSNRQEWSSQKRHYDFQVDVKKKSVPTGIYRISAAIRLLDKNRLNLAVGYSDGGIFQVYEEIPETSTQYPLVLSYLGLRKGIGIIGMALPFVLVIGKILLESPGILDSISAYYYSVTRNIFVGSLCAIAIFLISYRYERLDDIAGDLAGASAIGVALFPTAPDVGATGQQMIIGLLHGLFAACFFSTLAFFALVLFRKTDQNKNPTRRKRQRNMVYLFCGIAIIVCLVLIGLIALVSFLSGKPWLQPLHPVFWLEALAIQAFGVAWFVKGETILKDE